MAKKDVRRPIQNYPYFMPRSFELLLAWLENFAVVYESLEGRYGITKEKIDQVKAIVAAFSLTIKASNELAALLKLWNDARNLIADTDPDPIDVSVAFPGDWRAGNLPLTVGSGAINYIIEESKRLDMLKDLSTQDRIALRLVKPAPTPSKRKETAEKLAYPYTELVQVDNDAVLRVIRGDRYKGLLLEIKTDMKGDGVFLPYDKNLDKETVIKMDFKPGEKVKSVSVTCVYLKNGKVVSEWSPVESISVQKMGPTTASNPAAE